ncbi:hypothetical protein BJY01DRAFT_255590 [Aspergillus pseudoustus]|uniref:NAD(P)-binding protein n=1 Tax=Aspergillus pseudoustus TaxID=1810923 RepID=A0ABR4IIX1_9EURO
MFWHTDVDNVQVLVHLPSFYTASGANRGIGLETAKNLFFSTNYHIILSGRNLSKATAAAETLRALPNTTGTISPLRLDVTSTAAKAHIETTFAHLDILINNAAIYTLTPSTSTPVRPDPPLHHPRNKPPRRRRPNRRLPPAPPLRISTPTPASSSGTFASGYRVSKAALNMLLVQYHARLEGTAVEVYGIGPGFCVRRR